MHASEESYAPTEKPRHLGGRPEELLEMLVAVKTYPVPSVRYQELVCTAGIDSAGRGIRLYPVRFRHLPAQQQYRRYDVIQVRARRRAQDQRRESYTPVGDIHVLSHIGTRDHWRERKSWLAPLVRESIEELASRYDVERESMGLVRPAAFTDVIVREDRSPFSPRQQATLDQMPLFGPHPRPLVKLPHSFHYRFRCDASHCRGHELRVIDWEVCALYLKYFLDATEAEAVEKTKLKCQALAGPRHDTSLFVGTHHPYRTFLIVGLFYPPRDERLPLPLEP